MEFKSDRKRLSDEALIDAVVAFANTEGGELYLGVEDDGTITGRHESHSDITQLAAFVANKTIPPLSVRVEKAAYVRQTDIERIRYPELILKLAETQGTITRGDVVELLHVTPPQAYRLLQKLVKKGELVQTGTMRNTSYRKR